MLKSCGVNPTLILEWYNIYYEYPCDSVITLQIGVMAEFIVPLTLDDFNVPGLASSFVATAKNCAGSQSIAVTQQLTILLIFVQGKVIIFLD